MLVLTRKAGETIVIGDNIEITVIEVQGGKIKVGIDAPRSIKILRKEILEEVKSENINATLKINNIKLDKLQDVLNNK